MTNPPFSRRRLLQAAAAVPAARLGLGQVNVKNPVKRPMGRLQFEATTLGLGGQASLQWTPDGVDPARIILKAFKLGINYFDTSNAYGPSQANFGKAFRELHLVPGEPGYDERLRRSFFLTTKTGLRFAKGGWTKPRLGNFTNGKPGSKTLDDVRRSLSLMFGDGEGNYPKGAYLDMVLLHHLSSIEEVDAAYEGLAKPSPSLENIGALAALVDVRDGTNLTGLNPKEEKLIRHIGFSGHHTAPVMMEMIQRDERNILDGMLVAINANDRQNFNMQYNVIPMAAAKNMGLIAMKVFADGAMYTKGAHWSTKPEHVVLTVGSAELPSRSLVEYTLSTPGIHTAIIGTGRIDEDAKACQMTQNLAAAQIAPKHLSVSDRRAIEKLAAAVKDGKTNWFQLAKADLTAPRDAAVQQSVRDGKRVVRVSWQTAYAGDEPIARYEIRRDHKRVGEVAYRPQTGQQPFVFEDAVADKTAHSYEVVTVDAAGRTAAKGDLTVESV